MIGIEVMKILNPGVHATIQDHGRIGFREFAIPKSGSLDSYSHRLANYLVGNSPESSVIEIVGRFTAQILSETQLGVFGLGAEVSINGRAVEVLETINCLPNDQVKIQGKLIYLAVAGGFNGRVHFGSLSTYPLAKLGGTGGGVLTKDEVLSSAENSQAEIQKLPQELLPKQPEIIRVLKGSEFTGEESEMEKITWFVSSSSNRMGLRLDGNLWSSESYQMSPVPVFPGTIQLPSDGKPIILLNDAQSTGGYPRVAQVIKADLSRVGRLIAGGRIRFKFVTIEEARHIFQKQEAFIEHELKRS